MNINLGFVSFDIRSTKNARINNKIIYEGAGERYFAGNVGSILKDGFYLHGFMNNDNTEGMMQLAAIDGRLVGDGSGIVNYDTGEWKAVFNKPVIQVVLICF